MAQIDFFALDIGKRTVKLVQVEKKGESNASLTTIGSIPFPTNLKSVIPDLEDLENMQLLSSTIKSLVESAGIKIKDVITAIPENIIFSKLFTNMPLLEPAKLEEAIYWEAKQFIPIPIEDAQTDWIEIERHKQKDGTETIDVMFIAAPRKTVEAYIKLFELAGLQLAAIEVESIALSRAMRFNYPNLNKNIMIVDLGAEHTNICVVYNGRLVFSQSISTGSDMLTKAITTDFGIQFGQAEQYKIKFGVLPNMGDGGKIRNSIIPIIQIMTNEIQKILSFIDSRLPYGIPEGIFITGSGSMLPGLAEYMQTNLNKSVSILDPLAQVKLKGRMSNVRNELLTPGYCVAVGLALKSE